MKTKEKKSTVKLYVVTTDSFGDVVKATIESTDAKPYGTGFRTTKRLLGFRCSTNVSSKQAATTPAEAIEIAIAERLAKRDSYKKRVAELENEIEVIRALDTPSVYCTTYCNHGHRLSDGKPVGHECYVLPPKALAAERADNFELAARLIDAAKPLKGHGGL